MAIDSMCNTRAHSSGTVQDSHLIPFSSVTRKRGIRNKTEGKDTTNRLENKINSIIFIPPTPYPYASPPDTPLAKNAISTTIRIDYQQIVPYNDLHLPLGNGAAKREQSQIYLNSAKQASHLEAKLYNGAAKLRREMSVGCDD